MLGLEMEPELEAARELEPEEALEREPRPEEPLGPVALAVPPEAPEAAAEEVPAQTWEPEDPECTSVWQPPSRRLGGAIFPAPFAPRRF